MNADTSLPATERLRMWQYERPDGHVFHCDLTETLRDWMLTLACNGYVFARQAFDTRPQAEAWAEDFWTRLTTTRASGSPIGRRARRKSGFPSSALSTSLGRP